MIESPVILVVDDEPAVTATLVRALSRGGWRAIGVSDPHEALAVLDREPVDLVITDKDMPEMTGHELLAILKDSHPDVPCVILTGAPSLESALAAVNSDQVVRYLTKPWTATELEHTVTIALERRVRLLDDAVARQAERIRATAADDAASEATTGPRATAPGRAPFVDAMRGLPEYVDKYQVLAPLGEGGMGTVYAGMHRTLQRPVAIKVLRAALIDDPLVHARFVREARAAVRARHPRIVETLDFGQLPDGRPYLVMELVEAETLRVRLRRGPLAPREAVFVALGIAEALAAAHEADVVHRDLKPGNVFVDELLAIKLADFGAARILHEVGDAITLSGTTLGTPYYMSPEHITGGVVDGRGDIYALGCVLFEMLAGHAPYRGDTARTVLAQHVAASLPPVTSPLGPVGPALSRAIHTAMAKEPRERHQNAHHLITSLNDAADEVIQLGP